MQLRSLRSSAPHKRKAVLLRQGRFSYIVKFSKLCYNVYKYIPISTMSPILEESGRSSEQPENLHKRWARQCDALLQHENDLLPLADNLPSYVDLLKDVRLKSPFDDAAISVDQLPEMRQRAVASLDLATEALKTLEEKSGLSFNGEVNIFTSVRDQLERIDLTSIPSSLRFQSEFPNHVYGITALRDNYPEYRNLQQQAKYMINGDNALRELHAEMQMQRGILEDAARNVRLISQFMEVARTEAVKKMKPFVQKLGLEVSAIADSCVQADRLTGERNPDVDIASSVSSLQQYALRLQKGNPEFLTSVEYRREVKGYLDKAYKEREPFAAQLQTEKVERPAAEPVEVPQKRDATKWSIWKLFGRK